MKIEKELNATGEGGGLVGIKQVLKDTLASSSGTHYTELLEWIRLKGPAYGLGGVGIENDPDFPWGGSDSERAEYLNREP